MFEALSDSMMIVLKWNTFVFMLFGIALGFIVGILPGLGGFSHPGLDAALYL